MGVLQGAIDLGAAPGAWTQLLARRARRVVAVDPAELSSACLQLPNVRHVQQSSEAVDAILAALGDHRVDCIVCDMNQPVHFCGACIAPLLDLLAPGGWVILTLKFYGMARDRCVHVPMPCSAVPVHGISLCVVAVAPWR